jgi:hypothetical protein
MGEALLVVTCFVERVIFGEWAGLLSVYSMNESTFIFLFVHVGLMLKRYKSLSFYLLLCVVVFVVFSYNFPMVFCLTRGLTHSYRVTIASILFYQSFFIISISAVLFRSSILHMRR